MLSSYEIQLIMKIILMINESKDKEKSERITLRMALDQNISSVDPMENILITMLLINI
jgi:hypothetical protein